MLFSEAKIRMIICMERAEKQQITAYLKDLEDSATSETLPGLYRNEIIFTKQANSSDIHKSYLRFSPITEGVYEQF
jgi:hypothetical protein